MSVFDILGPVMIGPSSSHTAGACRCGLVARALLAGPPEKAEISLYGSFAETWAGHCTDKALVGGILGFGPDDPRLRDSLACAEREGLHWSLRTEMEEALHPNTAKILLEGHGRRVAVTVSSVGGGAIRVVRINGADVNFSADYPTTVLMHKDAQGILAAVTCLFAQFGINIAYMRVYRQRPGQAAMTVVESDQAVPPGMLYLLRGIEHMDTAAYLPPVS